MIACYCGALEEKFWYMILYGGSSAVLVLLERWVKGPQLALKTNAFTLRV